MRARPILRTIANALGFGHKGERALFDADFYRAANSDVAASGIDPFDHYMRHGWQEGRDPSPSFSTLFYRDRHLGGAGINPLTHYAKAGGRSSGLETKAAVPAAFWSLQRTLVAETFDAPYYAGQSGRHDQDPVSHYLAEGWRSGYSPRADFDPNRYLLEHPFVQTLDVSPFYHFASQRRLRSGRQPADQDAGDRVSTKVVKAAIASAFDAAYYLAQHADLRENRINALDHFVEHGWREHRNPTPLFDTAYYRARNRDVADSGVNPFYHYLTKGRAEGRRPNPAGSRLYPKLAAPQPREWAACRSAADIAGADYVVVMPVYKGFDETLAAIHAVLAAPQNVHFALHVINDRTAGRGAPRCVGEPRHARPVFIREQPDQHRLRAELQSWPSCLRRQSRRSPQRRRCRLRRLARPDRRACQARFPHRDNYAALQQCHDLQLSRRQRGQPHRARMSG